MSTISRATAQSNGVVRKGVREEGAPSELRKFALDIGSTKGVDPIPPDQYLTLQDHPLFEQAQRLWAWLLSKTIRYGHRSPHAVDDQFKELWLKHAAADLGMDAGNARRAWRELQAKGRVRTEGRRLYLNGDVTWPDSNNSDATPPHSKAKKKRIEVCTDFFPPYLEKQIKQLTPERREALSTEYERETTAEGKVRAEAMAAVRSIFDQRKDSVLSRFNVKKRRGKKSREAESPLVPLLAEFVQRSVQTPASPDLRVCTNPENASVQTFSSLCVSETEEGPVFGYPEGFAFSYIQPPQQQPSEAAAARVSKRTNPPKPTPAPFAWPETLSSLREHHSSVTEHFVLRVLAPLALHERPQATDSEIADTVRLTWERKRPYSEGLYLKTVPEMLAGLTREEAAGAAVNPQTSNTYTPDEIRVHLQGNAELLRERGYNEIAAELDRLSHEALDQQALDQQLTVLEENMLAMAKATLTREELLQVRREVDAVLAPYRNRMSVKQLALLEKNDMAQRLLEHQRLRRLSLFYLERAKCSKCGDTGRVHVEHNGVSAMRVCDCRKARSAVA